MSAQKKMIPMQAFTYLVKVTAGSSESTRVWSSKQSIVVGHPMRWVVSQVEGGVKVTATWTETEHFIKDADIAKGKASIKLVCSPKGTAVKDAGSIGLEIRPVAKLAAAFRQEPNLGSSLKIFHCIGDWAVESVALNRTYVGKHSGKKVFNLKGMNKGSEEGVFASDDMIVLKARVAGLTFVDQTGKKVETLAKGEKRLVRFGEISGAKIAFEGSEWRLASFAKDSDPAFLAAPIATDIEAGLFKRTMIGALAASLLLALVAMLLPSPDPVAKVETIRILLNKKKVARGMMTAAPTGDPRARDFSIGKSGNKKDAGKKGALARSKKVAPAGKPTQVAKASKPAKKKIVKSKSSAPAKSVAKASRKKSSSSRVASGASKRGLKKTARVATRPAPVPHSDLFKAFSSSSIRRAAKGLAAGGASSGATSASDAHRLGSASGTGRGDLGGTGGVDTRSAQVSGFGGGGNSAGEGGPGSKGAGYGRGSNSKVSGQGRSFVSMDTGASDVDEGLTRDQVGKVMHAHKNEIRYCLDSAVLRSADIGGRVTTKFAVNASGNVASIGIGSSNVGDRRLHECLVSHIKTFKFPKPRGGVTVAVAYPFDFKTL
jgi:TonB family protein